MLDSGYWIMEVILSGWTVIWMLELVYWDLINDLIGPGGTKFE